MDPISEIVWPYILGFAAILVVIAKLLDTRRSAAVESAVKNLGFKASDLSERLIISQHDGFELFSQGGSRQVYKQYTKSVFDDTYSLYLYSYRENGGNQNAVRRTVLSIRCDRLHVPDLYLHPKRERHMLIPDFGQYSLGYELSETLSEIYVLKGGDEARVRECFHPGMIKLFEANPGFCLEVQGKTLIFYNTKRNFGAEDIAELYHLGQKVLSKLAG